MCGIAGILSPDSSDNRDAAMAMARSLSHRGPDAEGVWSDTSAGVALSHSRLSIIDLSPLGNQPMHSWSGRYTISFNGEIYNYLSLKDELEKHESLNWRGRSDTEVLLATVERYGIEKALSKINGMFAFALWDKKERKLTLSRDRLGEKPLYIGWIGKDIAFASELKAFYRLPGWHAEIDQRALGFLLRYGYIPAPLSIYRTVYKVPQARYLTIDSNQHFICPTSETFLSRCISYWDLRSVVSNAMDNSLPTNESAAMTQLDALLTESVRMRMIADVPIGSILSGGIDSSLISAIMQRCSHKPINTFTIGFEEDAFDEAKFARPVAEHIGSRHTEIILSHKNALDLVPKIPDIYDEPFADPSQLPTLLVSSIARQHVTVALSGDGGDELFGGYGRYWTGLRIWPAIKWLLPDWRLKAGQALANVTDSAVPSRPEKTANALAHRIRRFGRRISAKDFDSFYSNLVSLSLSPVSRSHWPDGLPMLQSTLNDTSCMDMEQRMMLIDQCTYLPDDVLVKTDRASMSVSLELRIPLLDHNVVEFAWRLPKHLRRQGNNGKLLLRRLLYRYVPKKLVERPKKGFEIPQDEWLRGPLRDWMLDILNPASIRDSGYLSQKAVRQLVREHLSGSGDHGYALWPILMFQAWLRNRR